MLFKYYCFWIFYHNKYQSEISYYFLWMDCRIIESIHVYFQIHGLLQDWTGYWLNNVDIGLQTTIALKKNNTLLTCSSQMVEGRKISPSLSMYIWRFIHMTFRSFYKFFFRIWMHVLYVDFGYIPFLLRLF